MMKGQVNKKQSYEERILGELNVILRGHMSDARFKLMSFTKVELNNDFSDAKVYWDTFNPSKRGDIKKAVEAAEGKFRSLLASSLNVRHTPTLTMIYDNQFESEQSIANILADENKNGKSF